MIIAALKESLPEKRVALTPASIRKGGNNVRFMLEQGAGILSGYNDEEYLQLNNQDNTLVEIASRKQVLEKAQILIAISPLDEPSICALQSGTIVIGLLDLHENSLAQLAHQKISAFSLNLLPRITRAQFMDVLSSQSSLAGYQAAVMAGAYLGKSFPMMMTASGTLPAARVLVIGAGVAGLQAIATAKRLGAVVSAFDVRKQAKTDVESLGAKFIEVDSPETGEAAGGYAKEMSQDYQKAQAEKLLQIMPNQDVIITTAQIPNRPAPKIITKEMVSRMPCHSLIIDLAASTGGNCELSQLGQTVEYAQCRIMAPDHILNDIAYTASHCFASNAMSFIQNLIKCENGALTFDMNDELIKKTLVTHQGEILYH